MHSSAKVTFLEWSQPWQIPACHFIFFSSDIYSGSLSHSRLYFEIIPDIKSDLFWHLTWPLTCHSSWHGSILLWYHIHDNIFSALFQFFLAFYWHHLPFHLACCSDPASRESWRARDRWLCRRGWQGSWRWSPGEEAGKHGGQGGRKEKDKEKKKEGFCGMSCQNLGTLTWDVGKRGLHWIQKARKTITKEQDPYQEDADTLCLHMVPLLDATFHSVGCVLSVCLF